MSKLLKETETSYEDLVLNPGSERNLISICLRDESKIVDVESEGLFAEHFGVHANKYIFMAIQYLFSKSVKPTPLAIMEVLSNEKAKKAVEEIGGLEYLTILEESTVSKDSLNLFIGKIKQSYTRRELYKIGRDTMEFAISDKAEVLNPSELVKHTEGKLIDLTASSANTTSTYKMGDNTDEVLRQRAENPSTIPGLEIGWRETDELTNGGLPGDLIVVCAESKTGKSVTLTNWCTKLSIKDKIPCLYIDSEMDERQQEDRILANLTGIPHTEILNGMYVLDTANGTAKEKLAKLDVAKQLLKSGFYFHEYMPNFTIEKVMALTRQFQIKHGIGALFFDYIKLPSSDKGGEKEYIALGHFTSGLKNIAGLLGIPVYAACQANRDELGNTEKDAKSLGGSYRILQLATKLMFLTNKSDEQIAKDGFQNGNQVLSIKYQRNGQGDCDPINIMFHKTILRQEEC